MNDLREAASMVIDLYLNEGSHSHPNFSCTMCGTGEHGYYPEKDHTGADTAKCGNCGSTNSLDFMKSEPAPKNDSPPKKAKPAKPRAKRVKNTGGEPFIGRDGRINSPPFIGRDGRINGR